MRKPVQIAISNNGNLLYMYALCDDGSMWGGMSGKELTRLPDIPQDKPEQPATPKERRRALWLAHDSTVPATEYFDTKDAAVQWARDRIKDIANSCHRLIDSLPCELYDGGVYVAKIILDSRLVENVCKLVPREPEPATSPDVVEALFALDNAEQQHRFLADPGNVFSREHSFAAWKTTRDAIDKVRKVLKRIDEQEEPR